MAQMTNRGQDVTQGMGMGSQNQTVSSPVSNDAYNILAALHTKLEGLDVYRKYLKDGDAEIWHKLAQLDQQCVALLSDELERLVREGKFRGAKTGH